MSKGSGRRPTDEAAYSSNWERIFRKQPMSDKAFLPETPEVDCQNPTACAQPFCSCKEKHEKPSN